MLHIPDVEISRGNGVPVAVNSVMVEGIENEAVFSKELDREGSGEGIKMLIVIDSPEDAKQQNEQKARRKRVIDKCVRTLLIMS